MLDASLFLVVLSAIRLLSSMAEIVGVAEWMSTQMSPPKERC